MLATRGLRLMANNAVGFLALFVALGGVGYAATGGFSTGGQLQACVSEGGTLTLLRAGKHCKRSQQRVVWNQAGAAGPNGAPGTPGAAGAKGADGPKGLNGLNGLNGESANIKWASIAILGQILAGKGVVAVGAAGTGYAVAFNSDITNCAVVVTPNGLTDVGSDATKAGTEVFVHIDTFDGTPQLSSFSIAAIC
jgi:hypothetical protein